MNEFQAAMGLCNLSSMGSVKQKRKLASDFYDVELSSCEQVRLLNIDPKVERNYAYYPVVFETEKACLKVQSDLKFNEITTRRYFYPSLNNLPYVQYQSCPISEDISSRILCLPLYADLSLTDASRVAEKLKESLKNL